MKKVILKLILLIIAFINCICFHHSFFLYRQMNRHLYMLQFK
nr:MAG TPA: hypothetical protein [Caudoviricetes sp.]